MARILGKHSRLFMPGETHFFDDIYARRHELGDPQDPGARQRILDRLSTLYARYNEPDDQERIEKLFADPTVSQRLSTACHTYRDMLSAFMELQTCAADKVRWGNNVPKDLFHLKEILAFYADAKILICIRDIRDFLLSYQHKWRVTSQEQAQRLQQLYHPIVTALLWKASVQQMDRARALIPPANLMLVRYESLVERPAETVRQICAFVGEEFEADMLAIDTHNSSFHVQGSGIFTSSVGRWRTQLRPEEVYVAQKLAGNELAQLGYALEKVTAPPGKLARVVLTLPYALWRALAANTAIRGPLIPYLLRRARIFLSKKHPGPQDTRQTPSYRPRTSEE
jgi:hypothetical protein